MARDLIPTSHRRRELSTRGGGQSDPFFTLHREMNCLFENVFRGFDLAPFGSDRFLDRTMGWPNIEVSETDQEIKVVAEVPGLEEKDIELELANGVLAIRGEKRTETDDKDRLFSERYYGRFERRISVENVEQDNVSASFKNGVLIVTLPKSPAARQKVKRIAINGK